MKDLDTLRIICTGIAIFGAIILIALERMFPYIKEQKFFREGFLNDFFWYTLVQSYVLGLVISYVVEFIDTQTAISRIETIRNWPLWGQVLFFLVTHDFYIYWFHRWQHNNKYLWRTHEAHHSVRDVDWIAGMRSHSLEILINQSVEFVPMILLASPEVAVIKGAIDAVWGMYIHSNIDVHTGKLQLFINGPEMHRWHHADEEEAYNQNYSTKLAIWDWLFSTVYFPKDRKVSKYGLSYVNFPKNYFKQQIFAFRKFSSDE